ncbi:TIGR02452 family protein [Paenibacillus sp. GCM10027627]|uniref:TIGR02452 family protein n=1 Tax=unclassified Paenibacillus TaxID=185978 RepID=UPI003624F50B
MRKWNHNAGVVRAREPHNAGRIGEVMRRRIEKIFSVALAHRHETIVLGACGCGVFKNEPSEIAALFREVLESPKYAGAFKKAVFAVYDTTPKQTVYQAFQRVLS